MQKEFATNKIIKSLYVLGIIVAALGVLISGYTLIQNLIIRGPFISDVWSSLYGRSVIIHFSLGLLIIICLNIVLPAITFYQQSRQVSKKLLPVITAIICLVNTAHYIFQFFVPTMQKFIIYGKLHIDITDSHATFFLEYSRKGMIFLLIANLLFLASVILLLISKHEQSDGQI